MARILAPIIKTLDNLEQLIKDDDGVKALIDGGYGGLEQLRMEILHDFFRSAFDGIASHTNTFILSIYYQIILFYLFSLFHNCFLINNPIYNIISSCIKGSGADNFYDAGSCIDGRLTSAWNWCNQLPDKPYFVVFKLTGFSGFDGQFEG